MATKTPKDKTYFSFGKSSPESIRDSWYFNPKQSALGVQYFAVSIIT